MSSRRKGNECQVGANRQLELYQAQYDFVACPARFSAFIGGIGSGKTYAGAVKAFYAAAQSKTLGLVVSPTYPMLRDATVRVFLDVAGNAIAEFHKTEMIATLVNGSEILFRSADDPNKLRGPSVHWGWL